MLAKTVILAAFLTVGSCIYIGRGDYELKVNPALHSEWRLYKERHGKRYLDVEEEFHRRLAWEDNLKKIEKHNREYDVGLRSYTLGANKFADLTNEEYRATVLRKVDRSNWLGAELYQRTSIRIPDTVDWRKKGCVTPVKDQSQSAPCWAFSAVGSIETEHCIATKQLVALSEQNLIDCCHNELNEGVVDWVFQCVIKLHGIDTEASYPSEVVEAPCHFNKSTIGAVISSYMDIPEGDEKALTEAIATSGAVSVGIDASQLSFQLYESGVYDEPNCSSTQLDHDVVVVGYGINGKTPYYIVKNSWGASWGLQGYILMSRNKDNQCGIATGASFPIV